MSDWSASKVFFPGPAWVAPEVRAAMSAAPIYHRAPEFHELFSAVTAGLRDAMVTQGAVFVVTSSATGIMEGAIRNCVARRVLSVANGAFGERWHAIAKACGKPADLLAIPWGRGVRPEEVERALDQGDYDAVTLVHNETSTGVMNPLEAIARVVRQRPDTLMLVDTVSSLMGVSIEVDPLGLDVCLAGVQKCIALPPGLAVVAVSGRALERARSIEGRGVYFDFLSFAEAAKHDETPNTPSTSHLEALKLQLERIRSEGIDNRFRRHAEMAARVQRWAETRLGLYAEAGYRSQTVTCVKTPEGFDTKAFLGGLRARGFIVAEGYGRLKSSTFRVGHMGDLTMADVEALLGAADSLIADKG